MVERYEYQDAVPSDVNNLNGQLVRHYDPSGRIETIRRDFKGNVQEMHRTLTRDATVSVVDWECGRHGAERLLEQETYVQLTEHDALNRMTRLYNWHRAGQVAAGDLPAQLQRARCAERRRPAMRATSRHDHDEVPARARKAIQEIRYNAKGQKEYLELGNGTSPVTSTTRRPSG